MDALALDLLPESKKLAKRSLRVKTRARKDDQLAAALHKNLERFAHRWTQGLERADDTGKAGVSLFNAQVAQGSVSTELATDQAAVMASMLGAYESRDVFPYAELLWRTRGPAFCVRVLVEMWRLETRYSNGGKTLWLRELPEEGQLRLDASVSYGKHSMARFLFERGRDATNEERADLARGAEAYRDAPFHVQVPVVFAVRDAAWADDLVDQARKKNASPGLFFDQLVHVTEDVERIQWFLDERNCRLGLPFVLRLPPEATVTLYEHELSSKIPNTVKAELLRDLVNIRGRLVAKLLLRFAEKMPFRPHVRSYFERHPELLGEVSGDESEGTDPKALLTLQKAVDKALRRTKA